MGEVYRAVDTRRGRTVALKVLAPGIAGDEQYRSRFRRESDNAAKLTDPHVIPIHDFGEIEGRLFIDMRLVDGRSLDSLLSEGPLPPARAVAFVAQVAEALADAHAHGIVHRDVKPSNMLVTRSDFVYLVDFGIARSIANNQLGLTQTGTVIGTLAYMAPERFEGGQPDSRSDIYSLACVLAECVTGCPPFDTQSAASLMHAHLVADPPQPSRTSLGVPRALDEVIARGMAKDPADRYQSPLDLAIAAKQALRSSSSEPTSISAVPATTMAQMPNTDYPSPTGVRSRWIRSHGGQLVGAVALMVATGVGGYSIGHFDVISDHASPVENPEPPIDAAVASGTESASAKDRSKTYTYKVESNYPVFPSYIDSNGDNVQPPSNLPAPWSITVTTEAWGKDARPSVSALGSSKGDTTVTCSILDDHGRIIVKRSMNSANAQPQCYL